MILICNYKREVIVHLNCSIGHGIPNCVSEKLPLVTKFYKPYYISVLRFSEESVILNALGSPAVNSSEELWLTQCFHPFISHNPSNKDMQINILHL